MASVSFPQKLVNWAGSKEKLEGMTPAEIKKAATELKVSSSKVLDAITKLQDTNYAGVTLPKNNALQGNLAPGAAAAVPQRDVHEAAPSGPPRDLDEATSRIRAKLGSLAEVFRDQEGRVEVRFPASNEAKVEAGLKELGVKKFNTGVSDAHSFGQFDIVVTPYARGVEASMN